MGWNAMKENCTILRLTICEVYKVKQGGLSTQKYGQWVRWQSLL